VALPIDPMVARIARERRLPAAALDCGCGKGQHAVVLAEAGFTVDAYDANPRLVELLAAFAEKHGAAIRFTVGDVAAHVPARTYDAIVAINVLHFLTRDVGDAVLARWQAATAPSGVIALGCIAPTPGFFAAFPDAIDRALYDAAALRPRFTGWTVLEEREEELEMDERARDGAPVLARFASLLVQRAA
jgi:2-polyprenyl-3-methyl-5-hydroxy-6-metoxy-1,4-benzoquinol methylase